jgi:hypothetical protein
VPSKPAKDWALAPAGTLVPRLRIENSLTLWAFEDAENIGTTVKAGGFSRP